MFGSNHQSLAHPKPRPRVLDRRALVMERARQEREMRATVRKRDGGKCRACGKPGSQVHHLVYRSHGGKDEPRNGVLVCQRCHEDIHAKLLRPVFQASNPARTVRFELVT